MIGKRDVAWVAVWAAGTFGVAGMLWGTGQTTATDAVVEQSAPVLRIDGLEVRVESVGPLSLGEKATVRLVARNPGKDDVASRVRVQLSSLAPESAMSRVPSFPRSFYQGDHDLIVQAGKVTSLELTSEQVIPGGTITAALMPAVPAAPADQPSQVGQVAPLGEAPLPQNAVVVALGSTSPTVVLDARVQVDR